MGDSRAGHGCARGWGKWDGQQHPSEGHEAAGDKGWGVPGDAMTGGGVTQGTWDNRKGTELPAGDKEAAAAPGPA